MRPDGMGIKGFLQQKLVLSLTLHSKKNSFQREKNVKGSQICSNAADKMEFILRFFSANPEFLFLVHFSLVFVLQIVHHNRRSSSVSLTPDVTSTSDVANAVY